MNDIESLRKMVIEELSAMAVNLGGFVIFDLDRAYVASYDELLDIASKYDIKVYVRRF